MTQVRSPALGHLAFECDKCRVNVLVPRNPRRWANDERAAESVGWRAVPTDGGWRHYCPKHLDAAPSDQARS